LPLIYFKEINKEIQFNYKRQAYLLADSKKNYGTTFQDEVKALNGKPYYPPPDLPAKKKDKDKPKHTNRLAKEQSPYLLMHAHNPTDWYPWGPEAFEKAKKV